MLHKPYQTKASKIKIYAVSILNSTSPHCAMSADRPYQSHLFNSLNRNVQRLKDRAGLLWRNFKVVVLWGAQISLYPVYAVLNTSRQVSQKLKEIWYSTRVARSDSALIPPSDAPLLTVLTALVTRQIATLPAGNADCLTIALAQGTQIQGFASVLSTRRLTIVTTTSETLDILSESQENELRQRIIYEIASYWRLVRSRRVKPTSGLQASSLPVSSVHIPTLWNDRSTLSPSGFQREWLDLIQAAWLYFFGGLFDGREQSQFWGRSVDAIPSSMSSPQISVISAIAIDLWADSPDSSKISTNEPSVMRYARYDRPKRLNFVAKTALTLPAATATTTALPPALTLDRSPFNTLKHWIKSRLRESAPRSIVLSSPPSVIPRPNAFLSAPSRPSRVATQRMARAPEWLEVSATNLGYEVSWLDRMVLGLDRAIVFLEQIFLTFWAWLQLLRKS